jgi:hypothetical protein
MKILSEEIAQAPASNEPGILVKHYKCSYCGHREAKEVTIAALSHNIA